MSAGDWYIFDGAAQHGPMARAEVERFLSGLVGSQSAHVWHPGLEGWKPARQFFANPAPSAIDIAPAEPRRRGNFIARQWRGNYSLGVSYWCFVVLGSVVFVLGNNVAASILYAIAGRSDERYEPLFALAHVVAIWALTTALAIWQTVGVWRSANRSRARCNAIGKRAGWAVAAKIAVTLGSLSWLGMLATDWPQLHEAARMALLDDPDTPPYEIRLMRNGTEAEITGGFKYGLTADFTKTLQASPNIKVVHLNSMGGRMGEAMKLHDLLQARRIDTYVASECYSACTIAFAAGRQRIMTNRAVLGFHAGAFPGMSTSDIDAMLHKEERIFAAAGFDKSFTDKAQATPNTELWKPPVDILTSAHVVTNVSDGTDFAISGLGAHVDRNRMAGLMTANNPTLKSIESRFPDDYARILDLSYQSYVDGRSEAEVRHDISAWIDRTIVKFRPMADDDVLVEIGLFYADKDEALGAVNAASCYGFASGDSTKITTSVDTPASMLARENELTRRVLETARPRDPVPDATVAAIWKKLGVRLAAKGVNNDQIDLLNSQTVAPDRYAAYCSAFVKLYREMARLPPDEAATLIRSLLNGK